MKKQIIKHIKIYVHCLLSCVKLPIWLIIYLSESSNTDCVVNVKSVEVSNELGQSLPGLQIYPNFAQNSESASLTGRSKRIIS